MPRNMIVRLGVDASDFKKKMAQAGAISAVTGAKIKNALAASGISGVRQVVSEMESARDAIVKATEGLDISRPLSEQIKQMLSDRDKISAEMAKVSRKISEAQSMPVANTDLAIAKQEHKIRLLKNELSDLRGVYAAVSDDLKLLQDAADSIDPSFMRFASHSGLQELEIEISSLKRILDETSDEGERAGKSLRKIGDSADSSNIKLEKMVRSIRRIGIASLAMRFVRGIFGELGTITRQYISENEMLQAQVDRLRSAMGSALAPAINVVTNALSALMPYVVGVSNAIGSLISNLFGSGWSTVAADASAAAKAIGGAGGAQKEFNRSLQGFDEITKLNSKESGGGGGGGGSSTASTTKIEGITPAWVTSFTDSIKKAVQNGDWAGVGASVAETFNKAMASQTEPGSTIGATIAGWVNAGIEVAVGFIENLDWGTLIDAIWTNLTDLLTGIFPNGNASNANPKTHGGMSGGMARYNTEIKSPIKDYFKEYIKTTQEDYPEIGKDIGLGIIRGIWDAFENPGTWIKKYIFTPLAEDIQDVFGEDSVLGKYFQKWLLGSGGDTGEYEVDVQANITRVKDKTVNPTVNNGRMTVTKLQDNVSNRTFQNGKMWIHSFVDKSIDRTFRNGVVQVTSLKDDVAEKTISNGKLRVNDWKDAIDNSNKWLALKALVEKGWTGSLEEAMGIAILHSKLQVETPEVKVKWDTSYSNPNDKNSASVKVPSYQLQYPTTKNAIGAIFSRASLLGRVGGRDQIAGEAGREALLPLDRHTWWMDDIADRVEARIGRSYAGNDRPIQVNLVVDGKVLANTVVRNVNAQARSTGKNPLAAYI